MLNRSSNAVKTWVVVFVGALVLALSAFFVLSTFSSDSAFAQQIPNPITYDENGTGPVITLTSSDPEGRGIDWDVMGTDAADFTISSGGVLTFRNSPNHESATDRAHAAIDINGDGVEDPGEAEDLTAPNNDYQIIIRATERRASGYTGPAKSTKIGVTVRVANVNESGTVTLDAVQPEHGREITATLTDPDGNLAGHSWQWSRSKVQNPSLASTAHWENIGAAQTAVTATYTPDADEATDADRDRYLRVVVSYTDEVAAANQPPARAVTAYDMRAAPANNGSPDFPAGEHTRSVSETAAVGAVVGSPVTAIEGDTADQGKLIYGLIPDTTNTDDAGYFSIDQTTGQIRVAARLDADTTQGRPPATGNDDDAEAGEYIVVVTVSDPSGAAPTNTTDADDDVVVTITATQGNENPVVTGAAAYEIVENENLPVTATYTATDVDPNPSIGWTHEGDDKDLFTLSGGDTRTLAFKSAPDYEAPGDANGDNIYEVTVVATDGQGGQGVPEGRGIVPVRITVTDVDEVSDAEVTLSAEQPHLDTPLTAALTLPDGDVTIISWQWSRASSSGDFASDTNVTVIDGATSDTYTPTAADNGIGDFLEAKVTFIYKHTANLPGAGEAVGANVATELAVVSENAIQAAPGTSESPMFPSSTLTREVHENATADARVGDPVTADDADSNDVLTYELEGRDERLFELDSAVPGQIIVSDGVEDGKQTPTLDYEESQSRRFLVTVTATDSESNSATATVNINVTDVNEAPEFNSPPNAAVTYNEDRTDAVVTLQASDPEGRGIDWDVMGTDAADFTISSGGVLTFRNSPNHESATDRAHAAIDINGDGVEDPGEAEDLTAPNNDYQIIIRATERRASGYTGPAKSTKIGVTVRVANVNESGTVTLDAVQPEHGREITATLTDPDGNLAGHSWQWSRSKVGGTPNPTDPEHWENIGAAQTAVTATYTPDADEATDADRDRYLRVVVSYTDEVAAANQPPARAVTAYDMRAAPANNGSPDFPAGEHTRSVSETAAVGAVVGSPVTAIEGDTADQGKLIYGLIPDTTNTDDAGYFSIDQTTGQIRVAARLDADTTQGRPPATGNDDDAEAGEYIVVVTVSDPSGAAPTNTTDADDDVVVTITATQGNENPVVTGAAAYEIVENENLPVTATYTATDVDPNPSIGWTHEGDDKDLFTLSSGATGRILAFKSAPDYEAPGDANGDNIYEVTVVTTDGQGGQGVPEGRGIVPVRITVTNVAEDGEVTLSLEQPHVGEAITATLSDPDIPAMGDVIVNWQWGTAPSGGAYTNITGATSATYTPGIGDTGDYLQATATYTDDAGTAETPDAISTYGVLASPSVNNSPEFPASTATRAVNENAPAGTAVGAPVKATDPDGGETLTYALSGADAGFFGIDTATGQITVGTRTELDYDSTKKTYTVVVTVEDASEASDTVTVTISLVDMNEVPSDPEQSFGIAINGLSAHEYAENGMNALPGLYGVTGATGAVTWSVTGADAADFTFNSATGELSFAVSPDFEMPADDNTNNAYEITLNATSGLDVDDLSVTVTVTNMDEDGTVTLDMATPQVGEAITAELMDPDGSITGTTWQWASSDAMGGPFTDISGATSAAYTPMDTDAGMYLRAMAMYTDGHSADKTEMVVTSNAVGSTLTTGSVIGDYYDAVENGGNGDGMIEIREMLMAVRDYFAEGSTITVQQMLELVGIYFRS